MCMCVIFVVGVVCGVVCAGRPVCGVVCAGRPV